MHSLQKGSLMDKSWYQCRSTYCAKEEANHNINKILHPRILQKHIALSSLSSYFLQRLSESLKFVSVIDWNSFKESGNSTFSNLKPGTNSFDRSTRRGHICHMTQRFLLCWVFYSSTFLLQQCHKHNALTFQVRKLDWLLMNS